ncbi:MAG: mismatch-specific DNA-glycosylase [Solirubrobacterales bacterium]|nr:mismatch-specific DNA-glycosylase [Solirubrobacterales bacterium]
MERTEAGTGLSGPGVFLRPVRADRLGGTLLPDILSENLTVVFVGTAKSEASARAGHYYANPRNGFWGLLRATGLTGGVRVDPSEDRTVLDHGVGLTDLVAGRAASSDGLLRAADFDLPGFVARVERFRPIVVAFNGGNSASRVARHLGYADPAEGPIGWELAGSSVYRLPSSSSANATGGYAIKRAKWVAFGEWVRGRPGGRDRRRGVAVTKEPVG